jgi:hypothetical protein
MVSFFAIVGGGTSLAAVLMATLVYAGLPQCPDGQVAFPVFGKGIYCVQATKWRPAAMREGGENG